MRPHQLVRLHEVQESRVARVNIWGRNRYGQLKGYAVWVDPADVPEYVARAKEDGWTDLMTAPYVPSALSDADPSNEKSEPSSSTSVASSTASAGASRSSRRRASRRR